MKRLAILGCVGEGWSDLSALHHGMATLANSGLALVVHGAASLALAEIATSLGVLTLPSSGIVSALNLLHAWSNFGPATTSEVHLWPTDDKVTKAVAKAATARSITVVSHQIGAKSA